MSSETSFPLVKRLGLFGGLTLFVLVLLAPTPEGMTPEGHRAGAIALLMALWWITEAAPLAATALLPIPLFALFGILPGKEVTLAYGDANIFLFAGGFFIAMAMQKWNLHERIALNIVLRSGTNLNRLVLGFMIASAFLSMWISNTATTLMMLPIAIGVVDEVERSVGKRQGGPFAVCLLLGVAYGASIGGVATLIGTPPNIVLTSQLAELYPEAPEIGFLQWMLLGLPLTIIFLPCVWLILTRLLFRFENLSSDNAGDEIRQRLASLGPMSRGEITVLIVSVATALSWVFRSNIDLGAFTIPGWSNLFPNPAYIHDSTVAIFFAALLFVLPVNLKAGEFALDWNWAKRIPWDVLILFGGGIAIAKSFQATGLVDWLGGKLSLFADLQPFFIVAIICTLLTFLTELTSNTATTNIMMPILGGAAAPAMGVNPLLLMIPGALSASCAFMLPVATPPNAIVFGSGRITIPQMAKAGLVINILGIALIATMTYVIGVQIFDISFDAMPDWAARP